MNPGLTRAKIAPLVITKARTASRIAWGAFLGSIKIKLARPIAKIALQTRPQPIANVSRRATYVSRVERQSLEACIVRNVWLGNLKKRRTRTKRYVLNVHPAITRIHPI